MRISVSVAPLVVPSAASSVPIDHPPSVQRSRLRVVPWFPLFKPLRVVAVVVTVLGVDLLRLGRGQGGRGSVTIHTLLEN